MNRRLRWTAVVLVGAALMLGVVLAVLGGPGSGPTRSLGRLLSVTKPVARVGLIHSQSGDLAISELSVIEAERLAIEEINAEGGIDGQRLEAVVADGHSTPAEFAAATERLIDKEGVTTLFGGWTSECRKAMMPVVEARSGLLFFPGNYEGFEDARRVIYMGGSSNQTVLPAIRWAFDTLNARRFFIVGLEEVWSRSCGELSKDGIRATGAEIVGENFSPIGRPAIETTIEAIRQAKPDVILNFLFGEANGAFYHAYRRAGFTPEAMPTVAFGFSEDEARSFVLADVVGHYASWNYFQSVSRMENQNFIRRFRARYGDSRTVGDAMVAAYNSVHAWAATAREVDSIDPTAVLNHLDRQSLDAPDGIVTIDSVIRVAWRPCHIGRLRPDGQFEIVSSISRPIRPINYPGTRSVDRWRTYEADLQTRWGGHWSQTTSAPSPRN